MGTGNMRKEFGEVRQCGFRVMQADIETDRQTNKQTYPSVFSHDSSQYFAPCENVEILATSPPPILSDLYGVKLKFHGNDTDTDILADIRARMLVRKSACPAREEVGVPRRVQLATSRTRTTILADLSADLSDTRAFPREDVR